MDFLKKILKIGISRKVQRIVVPLDGYPYIESPRGKENLEGENITSHSIFSGILKSLFQNKKLDPFAKGEPLTTKLNVIRFGVLKIIAVTGEKGHISIYIPPQGMDLYEKDWKQLQRDDDVVDDGDSQVTIQEKIPLPQEVTNAALSDGRDFDSDHFDMSANSESNFSSAATIPDQVLEQPIRHETPTIPSSKDGGFSLKSVESSDFPFPSSSSDEQKKDEYAPGDLFQNQGMEGAEITTSSEGQGEISPLAFSPGLVESHVEPNGNDLDQKDSHMVGTNDDVNIARVPVSTLNDADFGPMADGDSGVLDFSNETSSDGPIGSDGLLKVDEGGAPFEMSQEKDAFFQMNDSNMDIGQPVLDSVESLSDVGGEEEATRFVSDMGLGLSDNITSSMPTDVPNLREINYAKDLGGTSQSKTGNKIDEILKEMVDKGASDVHLSVGEPLAFRIDGDIVRVGEETTTPDSMKALIDPIVPDLNREEFINQNDTDFAYEAGDIGRFRVNLFRGIRGVGSVFRFIPSVIPTADQLKLPESIRKLCHLNKGLVIVTGPTGSGKSTTLAAMIDLINKSRPEHILTIEDPVEFVHSQQQCLINQRELHRHTTSFSRALKAALREDPDIVLIGEMRDLETIAIAIETAETGHLVFGTLHTNTAISTVDRVIDQFPADQQAQIRAMLSESLKGVVAQTLVKKQGGGRVAAHEILIVNKAVSAMIREGKTHMIANQMQTQKAAGNRLLNESLVKLVVDQVIDVEQAYMKAIDKEPLVTDLQQKGISVGKLKKLGAA